MAAFTRSASASIMNGASRLVVVSRKVSFFRAASASLMNAASRFAVLNGPTRWRLFVATITSWRNKGNRV